MSIRVFTDQQFSDGTTIDGNRLERAMQELEDRLDTVPDGDLRNRWTQTQIVAGWAPTVLTGATSTVGARPYLRIYNGLADEFSSTSTAASANRYRLKGTKVEHIDVAALVCLLSILTRSIHLASQYYLAAQRLSTLLMCL